MLILASKSPRRHELLSIITENFEVIPAVGEEAENNGLPPEEYVRLLAENKAAEVSASHSGDIVIGADTVVDIDGEIFGKPRDDEDARRMLRALSGRVHKVHTGVCVIAGGERHSFAETTEVRFFALSDGEISAYIKTKEPLDKAGAYGIQEKGALLVEGINGDYYNVMGLPVGRLCRLMRGLGLI